MVFSSNIFLFMFLPCVLAIYFITPRRFRNLALLAVSLVFYGWGEPACLWIMVAVIMLNYAAGLLISRFTAKAGTILALSVVLNLAILMYFKYAAFLVNTMKALLPFTDSVRTPDIRLPIGISFYIFQSMSYTIDVYRGATHPQHSLVDFGAYVSLFPQLIAGPIVRYRDVAEQLRGRRESFDSFASGTELFIIGLGKKVLIANVMGAAWEELQLTSGALGAWAGMFAYTLQIYFDFSGYSDMARGLGRMFGFEFTVNFDFPYISRSVTEFWRRWHISLSSWFREYVYIPLGGNRCGKRRQIFNILAVWSLTGLWHGASWNFVLWGMYYALLLTAEKLFLSSRLERLPNILRHALLLLAVSFGWMIFFFEDLPELGRFCARLVSFAPSGEHEMHTVLAYLPTAVLAAVASTPLIPGLAEKIRRGNISFAVKSILLSAVFILSAASLAGQSYNPFIYFRF